MTLHELAEQYREGAHLIYMRIKEIDVSLKTDPMCRMERMRMLSRKDRLEDMYYDALETARFLEEYHGGIA